MKKLVLTLTATLACVAAFAQGKIAFVNNSLHLVYYDQAGGLRAADAALANQGVSASAMPAGVVLVADLYGGTAASSLALISTTTFSPTVGTWTLANVLVPTTAYTFYQVQIRDQSFASAAAASAGGSYSGVSSIFNTTPGTSILYNSIVNHNSPANSTWDDGLFNMDIQANLPGARGAIKVGLVPEPSSIALAGLGVAALMAFRRRK